MKRTQITTRALALLVFVLVFAGCSGQTQVAPPTQVVPDEPVVRTSAVETTVAKLTIAAALNPSPTAPATETAQPAVVTATAAPGATSIPAGPTATVEPTYTPFPTLRPTTAPGAAVYPTRTPRTVPDVAVYVGGKPLDGTKFSPGEKFDAVWTLKNTGPTTWTTDYHIRFARGENFAEADRYYLSEAVKPGQTVDIIADMIAPQDLGTHVGYWEFVNGNGDIIFTMYVAITVQ